MFVRLYTGSDGQSHLEDMDMENNPLGYSVPQKATDLEFRNNVPDYLEGWHTAPTRQYVITLSGYADVGLGDGTVRTLGPGDVLLAEDVTGQGHTTTPKGEWVRAIIPFE